MTTPDPAAGDGGQQDDADGIDPEVFRSMLTDVLKSPGDLLEDLIATAAENSDRRREYREQPASPGYARRG